MQELLQLLGGGCYLLNKVFLSLNERTVASNSSAARIWRIWSWAVYLLGLPAWVVIFVGRHDWIAASLEAGGAPAMVLGLISAIRGGASQSLRWLDWLALSAIPFGLVYSLWDFGGLNTVNQGLELALVLGFLVGTYQLAKERRSGYLWYVLMHISCGLLMAVQGYVWLLLQQVVSLGFIADAFLNAGRKRSVS